MKIAEHIIIRQFELLHILMRLDKPTTLRTIYEQWNGKFSCYHISYDLKILMELGLVKRIGRKYYLTKDGK